MRRYVPILVILLCCSSCGILGLTDNNINPDPDHQARVIGKMNNSPIARQMDSLFARIDAASLSVPADLSTTTLVVETYSYEDFLKVLSNKYVQHTDDAEHCRLYERYVRRKDQLIKHPQYNTIYADKKKYETLNIDGYRYVLKTSNRLSYDPNRLHVYNDGFVSPLVSTTVYYIYDRKTGEVFRDMNNVSALSRKK